MSCLLTDGIQSKILQSILIVTFLSSSNQKQCCTLSQWTIALLNSQTLRLNYTGVEHWVKATWSLSAVDKEDSQAEQTAPVQETACFLTEEAVISMSRLINPWVSCYCTLPAIWRSQQNPAGHSSTLHGLPGTLKAVGCPPVERQILQFKVGSKRIG